MARLDIQNLYKNKTQISQTEWFKAINHPESEVFQVEDNSKRDRLKRLHELTGLPYDLAYEFSARAVAQRSPEFQQFFDTHADELWAVRLVPANSELPKLRMRGGTMRETVSWIDGQDFDRDSYRADFSGHANVQTWASIFIVNSAGVFGEIISGALDQLNSGFHEEAPPSRFMWDYHKLSLEPYDANTSGEVMKMLNWLNISDASVRRQLRSELNAEFTNNYLHGYFEANNPPNFGFRFIDYNRVLGRLYSDFRGQVSPTAQTLVSGLSSSSGHATGKVRVIDGLQSPADLEPGEILVCRLTTPDYLPLMQKATAIVTDLGGILSHAAIIARELGKPCLTATGNATAILKTGMLVEVDADAGMVRAL